MENKLRKAVASILYSAGVIDLEKLGEFGFAIEDFEATDIRRILGAMPEENVDDISTSIFILVAGLIKLAIDKGKEKVFNKFRKLFDELRRVDFVYKHFQTIFNASPEMLQVFLYAMEETIPGTLKVVDMMTEQQLIEMMYKIFMIKV